MNGFDFPFSGQSLVTLFSAPNYCYLYNNNGAVMNISTELYFSFKLFVFVIFPFLIIDTIDRSGQTLT